MFWKKSSKVLVLNLIWRNFFRPLLTLQRRIRKIVAFRHHHQPLEFGREILKGHISIRCQKLGCKTYWIFTAIGRDFPPFVRKSANRFCPQFSTVQQIRYSTSDWFLIFGADRYWGSSRFQWHFSLLANRFERSISDHNLHKLTFLDVPSSFEFVQ